MSAPPPQESLDVNPDWGTLLAPLLASLDATKHRIQCQLVFSLLVFLGLSIRDFLFFLFESSIPVVKQRVVIFTGNQPTLGFAPQRVYAAWHDRFPKSIPHLHSTIIKPCMDEIALQESNKVISDPRFEGSIGSLEAPYSWDYLSTFTTSPNEYRKKRSKKAKDGKLSVPVEADEWEETPEGSTDESAEFAGETGGFGKGMGFALVFVFTGTNVFPMILGLFLEIGGTGSRILSTLSNAGACVSITTIERLKKVLSEDAVAHAVALMRGPGIFYIIFDNINISLRKSQQRLFNKNSMIHATNAAVISIPNADPAAEDLKAKQKRRGKRAAATGEDIIRTDEDEEKICSAFVGLVMTLILAYCPGSKEWENRDAILKAAEAFMALDRPFPVEKTDG
ncbi:hypothetical protein B0H14DRAFT_3559321 [Mycena olivaceomarginata]|nr:hypothetical protein B0H14DRAFT_3559321 [Mycena olivaceomarginata]